MPDILVSFASPGIETEFAFGRVDLDTGTLAMIDLSALRLRFAYAGLSGLCRIGDRIAVGLRILPGLRGGIALLDTDLRVAEIRMLDHARDIHSMVANGPQTLLIVSSGTDTLVEYNVDTGVERIAYAASTTGTDTLHLNGLCLHGDRTLVSMFGPHTQRNLRLGRVVDIGSGETLLDGLRQPHSVTSVGDWLLVFESETGHLVKFNADGLIDPWVSCIGYMRGLCMHEGALVMGRSRRRRPWRGGGGWAQERLVSLLGSDGYEHEQTALLVRQPSGATRALRLNVGVNEIYDLLPLPQGWGSSASTLPPDWVAAHAALAAQDYGLVERLVGGARPDQMLPQRILAEAYFRQGKADPATACLRRIEAQLPSDPAVPQMLALGLAAAGNRPAALEAARRAHALLPHDVDTMLLLAHHLGAAGHGEDEIALLRKADAVGEDGRVRLALARALHLAGQPDLALSAGYAAVRLLPQDPGAQVQLARLLRESNLPDKSVASARMAVELDPSSVSAALEMVEALLANRDLPGAVAAMREVVSLAPGKPLYAARLARLEARYTARRGSGR